MQTVGGPDGGKIKALVAIGSMVAFFMTIMMIVLIMQGNRRFYYFEQITKMQSGMISFMAEVVEAFFAAEQNVKAGETEKN